MKKAATGAIIAVATVLAVQSADAWKDTRRAQRHHGRTTASNEAQKDRTQFDCREVVGYKINRTSRSRGIQRIPIRECPHVEAMEAGLCETHWLRGMRCTG